VLIFLSKFIIFIKQAFYISEELQKHVPTDSTYKEQWLKAKNCVKVDRSKNKKSLEKTDGSKSA